MSEFGDEIATVADRFDGAIRTTPVLDEAGVAFKLELLQHTGSFKPRGALNRALTSTIPKAGLTAASGGNHGLAVAWVARRLGVPAEIFVPEVSPPAKVQGLHRLGATVHVGGARYADALAACQARQVETGALDIHAYDHIDTIMGAGTIGREISEQCGDVDTVLVALGGGGLAAGIAAWFMDSDTQVVTVEPETSQCYAAAVNAGEPVDVTVEGVASDSLGARRVGSVNWEVLQRAGATPITVSDQSIVQAQQRFWEEMHLVVEPGGAAAAAALWSSSHLPDEGERVVVVVCGANRDPAPIGTTT